VDDARFQLAQERLKGTFKPGYDQSSTDLAIRELETFLRDYPASELVTDASARLQSLRERRAQHEYQVGQFYERQRRPGAAGIYYESVAQDFADTASAAQAAARLQLLQRRL
jgi:outer membrane protein assembly factor BamD